jgi:hypothetical protein
LFTGLPVDPDVAEFDRVWRLQRTEYLHSMALLVALLKTQDEVCTLTMSHGNSGFI